MILRGELWLEKHSKPLGSARNGMEDWREKIERRVFRRRRWTSLERRKPLESIGPRSVTSLSHEEKMAMEKKTT